MKLNTVIVDSDKPTLELVKGYCHDSNLANVVETFNSPLDFLNASSSMDYDLCVLDINLPVIDGLTVVRLLNGKPFIFVTASQNRLKEALEVSPVGIISKPVIQGRLNDALVKAHFNLSHLEEKFRMQKKEYESFRIYGNHSKVLIKLGDILFVRSDDKDPRNKHVLMRNGNNLLLKDCTFEYLLSLIPKLMRINVSEMILPELIKSYDSETITIDFPVKDNKVKRLSLSRSFKKDFHNRLSLL
jgi:DNA-binding LytR/AlgR family response regulator